MRETLAAALLARGIATAGETHVQALDAAVNELAALDTHEALDEWLDRHPAYRRIDAGAPTGNR